MDESVQSITSTLLARARARDRRAWERLVELYSPLVYHWCLRKGLSRETAEDVGQEVFLAVARRLPDYRHETFRGWLRTITISKIHDFWRKDGKHPVAAGGSENRAALDRARAESGTETSEHEDRRIVGISFVEMVRGEFSEQDFRAFQLLIVEELAPAEVAQQLGMTRNQVYLAKSRILHRLRETRQPPAP
jgi:RNA polymerase sigma-70 factor (ECF subfamily)